MFPRIFSLFPALIILMAQPVIAQDKPGEISRTISVTGEAEVRVVPDQVIISMMAEHRGGDMLSTQKKNDQAIAALIEFAHKKMDVEEKYIQTDFTNVQPIYRQCNYNDEQEGRCSPLEIAYYSVQKGVQVKLNKLENYETLISKALELGITNINNVEFVTTQLRQHKDKAREMAATAAQEKAQALAKTLGMELGKPVTINANQYHTFYHLGGGRGGQARMMQNAVQNVDGGSGESGASLALGQININAQVNVTFEIK